MVQWNLVESSFRKEYGITAREILHEMSWREFRVHLDAILTVEESSGSGAPADWQAQLDRAIGREPASQVTNMTLEEFMRGQR